MHVMIFQGLLISAFVLFYDVYSLSIEIEGNVSGVLGDNGTEISCSYTMENVRTITKVFILAFNRGSMTFEQIVTYLPNDISAQTTPGQYLKGRVTLPIITQSSTKAVMTFHKLMCIDETFYKCLVQYTDTSFNGKDATSNNKSLQVQVTPSKPDKILWMIVSLDSLSTTPTTSMSSTTSSLSTEVTTKVYKTISTLDVDTQNDTTASTHSTLPRTDHHTKYSISSDEDLSANTSYRTTTYYIPQTTTPKGIAEGDNITVICTGDVGSPAVEHFFQKYLNGKIIPKHEKISATSISEMYENCSYYRTSNLTFQVTAEDNNAVIRCVVNSSIADPDMYVETEPIVVYWDKSKSSTSGSTRVPYSSDGNKTADLDIKTIIGIGVAVVVVVVVIGVLIWKTESCVCRKEKKEEYKPVDRMESNMDQIESQETTQTVPSTSSTKKTTGYEDVDLDDTDMKFKLLSDEETIAQVKQHNEEYLKKLKEDEEREKDNPTHAPQAAVYACVNKPKNTTTTENKPPVDQREEDVYEDSKEGLYDTSGDRRHKEYITVENYDSAENLRNEESDHNDLFSEQNSQIKKTYGSSENKEEKRQVATVSPTFRLFSSSQGDGQKHKSDEIQPKTEKQTTHETSF